MVKVTLVNANLVQEPAVAPYALDILVTALAEKYDVSILDLTPNVENWQKTIDNYFSKNSADFIGVSFRNVWDLYFPSLYSQPEQGSFLQSHKRIVDKLAEYVPRQRIIAGGTGFSSMPQTMLQRTGLQFGVIGAGESVFPEIIKRLSKGRKISGLPFVYEKGRGYHKGRTTTFQGPINRRDFVDNKWYYENGEHVGLRTTNGCTKNCTYCFENFERRAKGNIFSNSIENILQELDQLVELGIRDIHLNDSEMNILPSSLDFSESVARAIIERSYPENLRFWSYMQPAPFDRQYAELWKKAGMIGILFGTDHTDPEILKSLGKWYNQEDIKKVTKICNDLGIAVMHELLFGMYGETYETMRKAIDFIWSLNPHTIGTTLGIGILPTSRLAQDKRVVAAIKQENKQKRIREYGIYCKGTPLQDPTYLIDPLIKIPEVYGILQGFVGNKIKRIMVPTINGTSATNNQLVNSDRIKNMKQRGQKGAHWYWYSTQFE